ncbi:regulatory protein RecX [Sinomicrobium weinanense]|uniref:Regulatory protein RecX n=1 Tax=Sinomicrobium weinanense TaxID=2842200 RepID=A0A926Q058_9FLAO|nr:regulatory protein RecX [Sinomicrobium weinanense]MBC9794647.1 RecX family transcriptional regulator [Sinomicrobium weinanense]MBU3124132.1 RecX family transcriptional regulator [Sinomicrobium weinanense]
MNKQTYTLDQAKRKLEHFCAYRERCHKEVVAKLREMRMIPLAVDAVVVHLIEHDFLNEERFARSFARGKFRQKKWGKQRIVRELEARDITTPNIRAALKEIDENDYLDTFHEIAEKRWLQISDGLPSGKKSTGTLSRGRKKLADYLLYRGWESHLVYEKVNELTR